VQVRVAEGVDIFVDEYGVEQVFFTGRKNPTDSSDIYLNVMRVFYNETSKEWLEGTFFEAYINTDYSSNKPKDAMSVYVADENNIFTRVSNSYAL